MKRVQIPENEFARLEALHDYHILDTEPEVSYDDLTALAANICGTSVAIISLVDENRNWFKSTFGINVRQITRKYSFCASAILSPELLEIEDASHDSFFRDHDLVTGPTQVRFYAGAPLINPRGHFLGALCVLDQKPRKLSDAQKKLLTSLARQLVGLMELRRHSQMVCEQFLQLQNFADTIVRKEQQLIESARLSSMARMATGVSSEISSPLQILLSKVHLVRQNLKSQGSLNHSISHDLELMENTIERIAKSTHSLRSFAREGGHEAFQCVSLKELLEDTVRFFRERAVALGIQFEVDVFGDLQVKCRPQEFSNAIFNLLQNSLDAVIELDQKWISLKALPQGENAIIQIMDSGEGIPAAIATKMMEPFFTTKEVGNGTGLGLSISKGLMERNCGSLIFLENRPNTTFQMTIPLYPNFDSKNLRNAA